MNLDRNSVIQEFVAREQEDDAALLIGDLTTQKLIIAWPKVNIEWDYEERKPQRGRPSNYNKLWQGVILDFDEISQLTGIPRPFVEDTVKKAQRNFWVYPDGTVHQYALQLSRATMAKKLQE